MAVVQCLVLLMCLSGTFAAHAGVLQGCGNYRDHADSLAESQQGRDMMAAFKGKTFHMYALEGFDEDKNYRCYSLTFDTVGKTYTLNYKDKSGVNLTNTGAMNLQNLKNDGYYYELTGMKNKLMGAHNGETTKLVVSYLGDYDLVLGTCLGGFPSRLYGFYAFSTSNLNGMGKTCAEKSYNDQMGHSIQLADRSLCPTI